jgi:polypeptide N-acetylgalactosaminyltransferase
MDEYKEYLYQRRPHYRTIDPGNLTAQLAVRTNLNCKPFSWFMKEVAFDLPKKYPPVEPPVTAEGEVSSLLLKADVGMQLLVKGKNSMRS